MDRAELRPGGGLGNGASGMDAVKFDTQASLGLDDAVNNSPVSPEPEPNLALNRLLAQIEPRIAASFSAEQLAALDQATRSPPPEHWVDYRASTRWLRRQVYVRLLIGEERRNWRRLAAEHQIGVVRTAVVFAVTGWLLTTVVGAALLIIGYIVKSELGIDLFDGPSFLHRYIFD